MRTDRKKARKGSILILSAVMMVFMFAVMAFSVDVGMAYVNRTEMQRCADAAAIAAACDLLDQQLANPNAILSESSAAATAHFYAAANSVGSISPELGQGDLEIGTVEDVTNRASTILPGFGEANAVRVRIQRTSQVNGETPYLFAPVLGHRGVAQQVEATAVYVSSFRGFGSGPTGCNLEMLPFALDIDTWDALEEGYGEDNWTWNEDTGECTPGADGVLECNLFPQDTGLPGNRGTVDIGHSGNSTNDIKRQILDGISESDLEYHGGKLEFDANGKLSLNGDTGISAAVKAWLNQILGEPRIIPVFAGAEGNGNNANYTCVKCVGVRVMEVKLTGKMSQKRVIIQPCSIKTLCGIPTGPQTSHTKYIFSPVTLFR